MQPCSDESFKWIQTGREEVLSRDQADWKCSVSNLIPNQFEAYAKICHQVEARYENIDDPLSDSEFSILQIPPCTELRTFVESLRRAGRGGRVRWRELAQLFGVPFESEICHEWFRASMEDPECWPRFLFGPDDGNLNIEELSALVSALRPFAVEQESFCRFSIYPFIARDVPEPLQFCGALEELVTFIVDGKYQFTPEYWWPADKSWCICSDYDLDFTIVAGSKNLISGLLRDGTLEAIEMTSHTRVDSRAPMPKSGSG